MKKVDVVYIGPPKSASTWLYNCFLEHPEISVPNIDSTHYFNINYKIKDRKWFDNLFENHSKNKIKIDMCQDYLKSPYTFKRIKKENPDMKIIVTLRNPLERAFSHYWHVKKKNETSADFSEVLNNYDLFSNWIETGYYYKHITELSKYFPKKNILILFYDDLKKNPETFLYKIHKFLEVDTKFKPSILNIKINSAGQKINTGVKIISNGGKLMEKFKLKKLIIFFKKLKIDENLKNIISNKKEYEKGIEKNLKKKLLKIMIPEIEKLEKLLNVKLSNWKK